MKNATYKSIILIESTLILSASEIHDAHSRYET